MNKIVIRSNHIRNFYTHTHTKKTLKESDSTYHLKFNTIPPFKYHTYGAHIDSSRLFFFFFLETLILLQTNKERDPNHTSSDGKL